MDGIATGRSAARESGNKFNKSGKWLDNDGQQCS